MPEDEDIRRALESGDIISIGPASPGGKTEKKAAPASPVAEIDMQEVTARFNFPIGIDFNKYCPPLHYLIYTEILEPLVEIPYLSNPLRYALDILRNQLLIGNISAFETSLEEFAEKYLPKKAPGKKTVGQAAINCLAFFLSVTPPLADHGTPWAPVDTVSAMVDQIGGTGDKKLSAKLPAASRVTSEQLEIGTVALGLQTVIKDHKNPGIRKQILSDLSIHLAGLNFQAARDVLAPLVTNSPVDSAEKQPKGESDTQKKNFTPNDALVNDILLVFRYLLTHPAK